MSSTPEGAFYNKALMPGWQKWMPTYRIGTITTIDAMSDTCSVMLEAAASIEQNLDINQELALAAVPVVYMDSNVAAFSVGDEVIVEFQGQDQDAPRVIGFKDHPKGSWRESWGDTVCGNHSWTYGYCLWDCVYITCPENDRIFTNERGESRLSLHGGSLTLATKYYGGGANLHSVIYLTNESDRPVLSKRQMRIKCFTQTPMYGGVNLYIEDSVGNAGYLAFGGWVNIGTINGVSNDIGAGIGIEKVVDLSIFGFAAGCLAELRVETWATRYSPPNEYCSIDIDYIIMS
jgi:hypothetical protein